LDFWTHYGIGGGLLVILGYLCLPRLTLLFVTPVPFSPLLWLGWAIWPSLVVAILSTAYWETNPILVLGAWAFVILKPVGIVHQMGDPPMKPMCNKGAWDEFMAGCKLSPGHDGPCDIEFIDRRDDFRDRP
jgi:hypothetical protein